MVKFWQVVLPELQHFPAGDRARAMHDARDTALDLTELLGMAVGLALATALTRWIVDEAGALDRVAAALASFVVALPLLAVFLGPFHWRRLRRGLREQLRRAA
jgi:hypothetical protein